MPEYVNAVGTIRPGTNNETQNEEVYARAWANAETNEQEKLSLARHYKFYLSLLEERVKHRWLQKPNLTGLNTILERPLGETHPSYTDYRMWKGLLGLWSVAEAIQTDTPMEVVLNGALRLFGAIGAPQFALDLDDEEAPEDSDKEDTPRVAHIEQGASTVRALEQDLAACRRRLRRCVVHGVAGTLAGAAVGSLATAFRPRMR